MRLCVIVLTSNLDEKDTIPKLIPKVCYKVGEKTMLETCLDNVMKLNPPKVILMVSKPHILYINKLIKYEWYARKIGFCIYQDPRKISLAETCYSGKDILVIPANAPFLKYESLKKIIALNRSVKVNNNIFYLKKEELYKVDYIQKEKEEDVLTKQETNQIETKFQLETVSTIFKKKSFFKKK